MDRTPLRTSDFAAWRVLWAVELGLFGFLLGGFALAAFIHRSWAFGIVFTAALLAEGSFAITRFRGEAFLEPDGIRVRPIRGRERLYPWDQVAGFGFQGRNASGGRRSWAWGDFLGLFNHHVGELITRGGDHVPLPSVVWSAGVGKTSRQDAERIIDDLERRLHLLRQGPSADP